MNGRTVAALVSIVGSLLSAGPALARDNCKAVKATLNEVHPEGVTTSGTSTNAGILTGTTFRVFNAPPLPTPVPTTVSTSSDWTLATHQGELKTSNVYLYDLLTGLWTALGHIDPETSTGRFAGATGILYFNGRTVGTDFPFSYVSRATGTVCFATEDD